MAKTIELINENTYDVYILPEAREKMEMYCELCEKEIGWLGLVERFDNIGFVITDVVLLKQQVHSTTTEIDPEGLLDFWSKTPTEDQCKIKLWGHSHVNMAPSPSGQDDSQMEYFKDGNEWFIRLITNKKGEMNITIYDYKNGFAIHNDRLITYNPHRADLRKEIEEEIKEKVSEKKLEHLTTARSASKYKYYDYDYYDDYYYGKKDDTKEKHEKQTEPMFDDIKIKYVKDFDEVLNDPDYWQTYL